MMQTAARGKACWRGWLASPARRLPSISERPGGRQTTSQFRRDAGRGAGHRRPQRGRQDHAVRNDLRPQPGDLGRDHLRRARHHPPLAGSGLPRRHRPDLSAQCRLRQPHGPRERDGGGPIFGREKRAFPGLRSAGRWRHRSRRRWRSSACRAGASEIAEKLPVVDRKLLMLAGALATDPRLLLMDEPVGGLNPKEMDQVMAAVRSGSPGAASRWC